ncbi:hypothetical protein Hanom_Chr11g00977371 [Helianthus anomalus]
MMLRCTVYRLRNSKRLLTFGTDHIRIERERFRWTEVSMQKVEAIGVECVCGFKSTFSRAVVVATSRFENNICYCKLPFFLHFLILNLDLFSFTFIIILVSNSKILCPTDFHLTYS